MNFKPQKNENFSEIFRHSDEFSLRTAEFVSSRRGLLNSRFVLDNAIVSNVVHVLAYLSMRALSYRAYKRVWLVEIHPFEGSGCFQIVDEKQPLVLNGKSQTRVFIDFD